MKDPNGRQVQSTAPAQRRYSRDFGLVAIFFALLSIGFVYYADRSLAEFRRDGIETEARVITKFEKQVGSGRRGSHVAKVLEVMFSPKREDPRTPPAPASAADSSAPEVLTRQQALRGATATNEKLPVGEIDLGQLFSSRKPGDFQIDLTTYEVMVNDHEYAEFERGDRLPIVYLPRDLSRVRTRRFVEEGDNSFGWGLAAMLGIGGLGLLVRSRLV